MDIKKILAEGTDNKLGLLESRRQMYENYPLATATKRFNYSDKERTTV